ncbi:MAG: DUF3037 domain-containing protein [Sphingomonas sp.]|nr:DUF3037 domain-containing protein [Sphingomonas sp.]
MTTRRYSYTVLRYVHDPITAEFVNVGVVLFAPADHGEPSVLMASTRKTFGRVKDIFPDLDREAFKQVMRTIERQLKRLGSDLAQEGMIKTEGDASTLAQRILPRDDSSLQWSALGSGTTEDLNKAFDRLYARFISRYDVKNVSRRSDEDVWKPVRQRLDERNLPIELEPKVIVGGDDSIEFQHAWKNGAWHVYEPLSLDLADAEGIYRKAHRWLGQLTSVTSEATEAFHPYFIVGAPSDPSLDVAYRRAIKILKKSPGDIAVFEEGEVDKFVDRIEDEVRAHNWAGPAQ